MIDWSEITAETTSPALSQSSVQALDEHVSRFYPATRNLILIHQGELLLSRSYDRNVLLSDKKPVRSVTKSIMSCLIGCLLYTSPSPRDS